MSQKLSELRGLLSEHEIHAYFLPNNDFHNVKPI